MVCTCACFFFPPFSFGQRCDKVFQAWVSLAKLGVSWNLDLHPLLRYWLFNFFQSLDRVVKSCAWLGVSQKWSTLGSLTFTFGGWFHKMSDPFVVAKVKNITVSVGIGTCRWSTFNSHHHFYSFFNILFKSIAESSLALSTKYQASRALPL